MNVLRTSACLLFLHAGGNRAPECAQLCPQDEVSLLQTYAHNFSERKHSSPIALLSNPYAMKVHRFPGAKQTIRLQTQSSEAEKSHGTKTGALPDRSVTLDSAGTQIKVFMCLALVLICTTAALVASWPSDNGQHRWGPSLLAVFGSIFFGCDNFISAYAGSYLQVPSAHMGMVFFIDGLVAIFLHFLLVTFYSTYKSEWEKTSISKRPLIFTSLTGFFIVAAMLCGNVGFNIDQSDSGPHQALVCGDILIVGPFFFWYYGEQLSKLQLSGCMLIIAGMVVMANAFASPRTRETEAFLWLFFSMVFYASSIISWRLVSTGDEGAPWRPRLLLIFGFMGLMGFGAFPSYMEQGGLNAYMDKPALLAWPLLNSAASFLGMFSLNFAYQMSEASTGAITAIVDSNSVVLLFMNAIILRMVPSTSQMLGMGGVLLGCGLVCSADF